MNPNSSGFGGLGNGSPHSLLDTLYNEDVYAYNMVLLLLSSLHVYNCLIFLKFKSLNLLTFQKDICVYMKVYVCIGVDVCIKFLKKKD